jgi:hypothetical protein
MKRVLYEIKRSMLERKKGGVVKLRIGSLTWSAVSWPVDGLYSQSCPHARGVLQAAARDIQLLITDTRVLIDITVI